MLMIIQISLNTLKHIFFRNINIDNSDLTDGKKRKKEKGVW